MKSSLKENKKKSIFMLLLTLIMIVLLSLTFGIAYAKYLTSANGSATAQVADMICKMEIKSSSENASGQVISPSDKTIINPYCIITETDVNYVINVTPKKDNNGQESFTMPAYNWYEIASPDAESGTKIATSTALSSSSTTKGNFKNKVAETRYYKIVFLNSGEQDITRYVDFELKAVQVKPE